VPFNEISTFLLSLNTVKKPSLRCIEYTQKAHQ
jgi:hypothetical protein